MATQTVKPFISILDAATGEQIDREMTDSEYKQLVEDAKVFAAIELETQTKKIAKSALLEKLGITEEEAALLLGGN
jgi:hypothetical protein